MSLIPAIVPASYSGLTALQVLQRLNMTTSLQLCLDAGAAASYTSGDKWLDISGNGYDFYRGVETPASTIAISGTASGTYSAATTAGSVSVGTAAADRMVAVCFMYRSATTISAVTIGGISATSLVAGNNTDADPGRKASIWAAMVPTGTTATVSWTGSVTGAYAVFRVTGLSAVTAADTLTDITNPISGSIDIPANGGMVACCIHSDDTSAMTWTGATEYVDSSTDSQRYSAASRTTVAAETGHTVSVSTGDTNPAMTAVSWAPAAGSGFTKQPTFNGTPGGLSSAEYFALDSAERFIYDTTNETWMQALHQDNAAFSFVIWFYLGTLPSIGGATQTLIATYSSSTADTGFSVNATTSDKLAVSVENAGANVLVESMAASVAVSRWNCYGLSVDEAVGAGGLKYQLNGTAEVDSDPSTYVSPSAANATGTLTIGARSTGILPLSDNSRVAMVCGWSRALSAAEMTSLFAAMRGRFGV